jgi:ribosomal protein S18 acetylase RimI-like enzyme
MSSSLEITRGAADRLDELEPLWRSMHAHHAAMAPQVAPVRPSEESWRRRRAEYAAWLAAGDAQLLIAERERRAVGYLMLRFMSGASTWAIGERVAEIESLSVLEGERGAGIGAKLIAEARQRAHGARLLVSVVHANDGALRFYEREGFGPFYVLLLEK